MASNGGANKGMRYTRRYEEKPEKPAETEEQKEIRLAKARESVRKFRNKGGRPRKYATKEERLEANRVMDKKRYARNHKPKLSHDLSTTQGKIDAFHELHGY